MSNDSSNFSNLRIDTKSGQNNDSPAWLFASRWLGCFFFTTWHSNCCLCTKTCHFFCERTWIAHTWSIKTIGGICWQCNIHRFPTGKLNQITLRRLYNTIFTWALQGELLFNNHEKCTHSRKVMEWLSVHCLNSSINTIKLPCFNYR